MTASAPKFTRPRSKLWLSLGISVWVCALAFGVKVLVGYELQAGSAGSAPTSWPSHTAMTTDGRPNLLLFLHPQCPCSRATVAELAQILAAAPDKAKTIAFVYAPSPEVASWSDADLVQNLRRIPGVQVQVDVDGRMARTFGAETSGQALLFDAAGHLQFSGGLTGARGHEGDNLGRRAVLARLNHKETNFTRSPIFGCSLRDKTATDPES